MVEQTQPTIKDVIAVAEFRSALRHFLRRSEKVARQSGLTPQRYTLLMMIKGAPGGAEQSTVTELAERLQLAQSTVTELVRRAETAGLIEREQSQRDARVALDQRAVADDRDGRADRQLPVELDRKGVHRDRADRVPPFPVDEHLGAGHVPPEPVFVTNRNDPDPGRPLGDECPAVARAFPRLEEPYLREAAAPRERRPQS